MKVFVVDPTHDTMQPVEHELACITVVDGMWVKELDLTPLAYVYLAEHRDAVMALLNELREMKRKLNDRQGEVWYKELPKFRPPTGGPRG